MMERFEDILAKNEETCVKRSDIKETCKADRSSILMAMTEKTLNFKKKKVGLEEKKVEFATSSEETNVLTLKMKDLDDDTRMIVQALHLIMLKCTKDQVEGAEKEAAKTRRRQRERGDSDCRSSRAGNLLHGLSHIYYFVFGHVKTMHT
ncbi:hypothetical protein ZWY2020_038170 [Hordeum vulgare]|nr:hypothetical protein ZWY2020_038170 [Hordeum vulgare]